VVPPRSRWTDERLDDMARTLEKLEDREGATQNLVAAHDLQLLEIEREKRTKGEHRWALYLVAASVALGELAQILVAIFHGGAGR